MSENIDRKVYDIAQVGNEALVSLLIGQGASVDWSDEHGWTALHRAAYGGNTHVAATLIDTGWSLEAKTLAWAWTPLLCAAHNGHLETAKCLLFRGANIDIQDDIKWTPLHRVSCQGYTDMVKLLLQCGANQEIRNNRGETAEDLAKNDETRAVFSDFRRRGLLTKDELFDKAVKEKHYDVAAILAYTSQDTYIVNKILEIFERKLIPSFTILDYFKSSISQNHPNGKIILQYFKKNNSSLNGFNTLHYGVVNENFDILKFSLENSANIEEKDLEGNTPLHIAAASDNEKIVKFLFENGASSTQFVTNKKGQIPLEIARHNKNIFRIVLIDFLNYALKSPKFSSNEFQQQLGIGLDLFCLKRDFDGNKTLFEFLNDQGMIKEREELIQLLIKIDHFRYQGTEEKENSKSKERVIKILRAGMKSSRGLKESIDSVQEKYSWEPGKIIFIMVSTA